MSKTKLKILTPTGVTIKDLEIALGEYTSDFRILVEHDEYRVLYTKEVTTENLFLLPLYGYCFTLEKTKMCITKAKVIMKLDKPKRR